jgi:crotonobetainyl-CoA:carnitine CoA-transferase CaiB-like acyl-CoA transferase
VATDEHWRGLVEALGAPDWATDPALARYKGRRARHDELDARLAAWAREQDAERAAELLVARGVPAAAARDPRSMYDHPQHRARNFYEDIEHPVVGVRSTPTPPFRFASVPRWLRTPAPTLGEHNHDILVGDLGISEEQYAALEEGAVIGERPVGV